MRLFNAFQIVCLFVAMPWIVQFLKAANFSGANLALYTCYVVYVVLFGFMTAAMYHLVSLSDRT